MSPPLTFVDSIVVANLAVVAALVVGLGLSASRALRRSPPAVRHQLLNGSLALAIAAPLWVWAFLMVDAGAVEIDTSATVEGRPDTTLAVACRAIASVVALVWAAGAILLLARLIRDLGRLAKLRADLRSCDNPLRSVTRELAGTGRSSPSTYEDVRIPVPLVLGFRRPVLVFPLGLAGRLDATELAHVVRHELAHIELGDRYFALLQRVAAVLLWWLPWVSIVNRELCELREERCDDRVREAGVCATGYAHTLVHVAAATAAPETPLDPVLVPSATTALERRIRRLLDPGAVPRSKTRRRERVAVTLAAVLALGVVSFAVIHPSDITGPNRADVE